MRIYFAIDILEMKVARVLNDPLLFPYVVKVSIS